MTLAAENIEDARALARPAVVKVLARYSSAPDGGGPVGAILRRLDASLRRLPTNG
jgi:hypothetical protein